MSLAGTLRPIARFYNRHTFLNEMRIAGTNHEAHFRTFLKVPDGI